MNLEYEILREHSQRQSEKIATWIGRNPKRFALLMELFLHGEYRVVQRASWVVSRCGESHPELIEPWLSPMINRARDHEVHNAVKRNVVRVLQFVDIPRRHQGSAAALCFDFLSSRDAPVAVKVFSMTVLASIAVKEPDLKNEVRLIIEQMMPFGSAGIQSRGKKILRRLSL